MSDNFGKPTTPQRGKTPSQINGDLNIKAGSGLDSLLNEIFDAPLPPPAAARPFQPFPEAYLAGPIPTHFAELTAAGLTAKLTRLSESEAAALVDFGCLWLDDRPQLNPEHRLSGHQSFRINPPAYGPVKFYEADPDRIIYLDNEVLIYNKESGRPSQGVPHDAYNNVLSALGRLLAGRGENSRLWLSHRLDADTSGLLMMARTKEAAGILGKAFQNGLVGKQYLALGLGRARPEAEKFTVNAPIAKEGKRYVVKPGGPGLASRTEFDLLSHEQGEPWSRALFLATPLTGRTHQIRLHLAHKGWPIAG
ncbi:RluA family pseudouridine synthase, partial [Deltaproteobacteria bacterium OttesenSCG-928-K17]|nr:RluA family pseudouridine synthase [Deltaproteobacteria bacterium OttesenSCG-928-K17]